jgi:hypothetical protein
MHRGHEAVPNDYLSGLRRIATQLLQLKHRLVRSGNTPEAFCDTVAVLEDVSYQITRTIAWNEYGVEIDDE